MSKQTLYKKSLQNILNSSEFKDSPTYTKLLTYLFDHYLKEVNPTETTIATEFLKRDESFNPSEDPIVRVYIHEIRKRLKNYYQAEGKKEKVRIEIPKGGYGLKFNTIKKSSKIRQYISYVLAVLLLFSVTIIIFLLRFEKSNNNNGQNEIYTSVIWHDILHNEKPILIVFGDVFFFREKKGDNNGRIVRDEDINSMEELESYTANITDPTVEVTQLKRHTYLIEYCPYSLLYLLPILNSSNKSVSIRLCSELTVNDLKTHNIIYVGLIKCLGPLNFYFKKSHINIVSKYTFSLSDQTKDTLLTYSTNKINAGNYHMDYGFIIKFLGPSNNQILLLAGTRLTGTLGVVDKITNVESIKEIENAFMNKYDTFPTSFEMLYEVFGLRRQFIQSDILYIQSTDDIVHSIWYP
ncbi:hypothetical protein GF337_09680 [candidate division KSB1 bacterium]|nr:hypothetical protein [candidate division KSB1 bacterium]